MRLYNSIRVDGSIFIGRTDGSNKIVWSWSLPYWLCISYCAVAEWIDPT